MVPEGRVLRRRKVVLAGRRAGRPVPFFKFIAKSLSSSFLAGIEEPSTWNRSLES